MTRYTPDAQLDLILDSYAEADEEAVCSQQPITYFQACWPNIWVADTAVSVGDMCRAPTQNGYVYECTVEGQTGTGEPPWSTTQDATFQDNQVTWKAHENFALINAILLPADFTKADGDIDGRKLTLAQKMGITVHTGGIVTHTALISNANKELKFVTAASTTLQGDDTVISGRSTLLHEMVITMRDPSAP